MASNVAVHWSYQCWRFDRLDVVLSLVDREGNPSPAKLSIRITQGSTSAVAGSALELAQTFAQKLPQPLVSTASTNMSDTLSNQQKLLTSFNALLQKFEPLVKIGDEVAKVRSSVYSPSGFIERSDLIFSSKDPSLCQFCMASAFCRNESELTRLSLSLSSYTSIRSDGASTTSSKYEDSRSPQSDGGYLLIRGFCRWTEEPPCSSRYHGRNTEADDRMWVFHSSLYTTQLWRYVAYSLKHDSGWLKVNRRALSWILSLTSTIR